MKKILLIAILFVAGNAHAQEQLSTLEMTLPLKKFMIAKRTMDSTYKAVAQMHKNDTSFLRLLKTSQSSWQEYKTTLVNLKFPKYEEQLKLNITNYCVPAYLAQIFNERSATLSQWLMVTTEDTACAGTMPH